MRFRVWASSATLNAGGSGFRTMLHQRAQAALLRFLRYEPTALLRPVVGTLFPLPEETAAGE